MTNKSSQTMLGWELAWNNNKKRFIKETIMVIKLSIGDDVSKEMNELKTKSFKELPSNKQITFQGWFKEASQDKNRKNIFK